MTEADLYKELGALTKDKDRWKESIPQNKKTQLYKSVFVGGTEYGKGKGAAKGAFAFCIFGGSV